MLQNQGMNESRVGQPILLNYQLTRLRYSQRSPTEMSLHQMQRLLPLALLLGIVTGCNQSLSQKKSEPRRGQERHENESPSGGPIPSQIRSPAPAVTLPYIGKPLPDDSVDTNRQIMTTPSQFKPAYQTADEAFLVAPDKSGLVVFVTPDPGNDLFSTSDGANKTSTHEDIRRMGGAKAVRMPGWAYTSVLPSGWVAAFCVGESCTDGALTDSDTVSFFYLDSATPAIGEP